MQVHQDQKFATEVTVNNIALFKISEDLLFPKAFLNEIE
jgi:hypothetical protein